MKKFMVTGASGFLGREVLARLSGAYELCGVAHRHGGHGFRIADIRDPEAFRALLREVAPDVVVHCAAYREPDFCEEHPEETRRLNVEPVRLLCGVLPPAATLLLMSTDYVFDGARPPYREDSARSPVSVYGRTKAEAEDLALARPGAIVLRVPLLIGAGPSLAESGFIGEMVAAVRARKPLLLDDVLVRFPTWTRDVAEVIRFILGSGGTGLFHYSGRRGGTRHAWTVETAEILNEPWDHLAPSRDVVPRRAARPPNSQLLPDRLQRMGYTRFTDFAAVVRDVLAAVG